MRENQRSNVILYVAANLVLLLLAYSIFAFVDKAFYESAIKQHNDHTKQVSSLIRKNFFYNEGKTVTSLISKLYLDFKTNANKKLEILKDISNSNLAYIMNKNGTVESAVIPLGEKEIVGRNYGFRPYFKNAIMGDNFIYSAVGVTTNKRGIYYSSPIRENNQITKVLVLKKNFDQVDLFLRSYRERMVLINSDGIIFSSNNKDWILRKIENKYGDYDKFKYAQHVSFKTLTYKDLKKNSKQRTKSIMSEYKFHTISENWKLISVRSIEAHRPKSFVRLAFILTGLAILMLNLLLYFILSINYNKE